MKSHMTSWLSCTYHCIFLPCTNSHLWVFCRQRKLEGMNSLGSLCNYHHIYLHLFGRNWPDYWEIWLLTMKQNESWVDGPMGRTMTWHQEPWAKMHSAHENLRVRYMSVTQVWRKKWKTLEMLTSWKESSEGKTHDWKQLKSNLLRCLGNDQKLKQLLSFHWPLLCLRCLSSTACAATLHSKRLLNKY